MAPEPRSPAAEESRPVRALSIVSSLDPKRGGTQTVASKTVLASQRAGVSNVVVAAGIPDAQRRANVPGALGGPACGGVRSSAHPRGLGPRSLKRPHDLETERHPVSGHRHESFTPAVSTPPISSFHPRSQ